MGSLTLIVRQSKSHTINIPAGTEKLLREPISTLVGKVTVIVTRAAKGTHHRNGISLKPRVIGSYEIKGTVKPGSNDGCREFVAQVHPPLNPDSVYSLWKDPPRRIKKQVTDPLPSKASIESFQKTTPANTPFNLNEFWKVEAHLNEALGCLAAEDIKDDVVDGDAFRTAVRMVLEARELKPTGLDLAQSLSTLTRQGRVSSIGNTRPFKSYRLNTNTVIKEEEVEHIETVEINPEEPQVGFVLQRFWQRNPKALDLLKEAIVGQVSEGQISKAQLGQAIGLVIREFGGMDEDRLVSTSFQALNLMGVIEHVSGDKTRYHWKGVDIRGTSHQRPWIKTPLIKVVGLATIVDELVRIAKGDEYLLDKNALYDTLSNLYVKKVGKKPTKTTIGHAIHRLFEDEILETRGPKDAKSYHLTLQAITEATTRKVVAPKVDTFSEPLPLTEILEALTKVAGSDGCLQIRIAVVTVSKTANCDEDKSVELIDELLKNGYLHLNRGRDLCSHKITAKAVLHLKENKKSDSAIEQPETPAPPAPEAFKEVGSPGRSSHSADARTIGDVIPLNGLSQLSKVKTALQTIEGKIKFEQERMASAQATVVLAQKAIAELEEDRRHLQSAEEALKQASKEAAELTAKYSE